MPRHVHAPEAPAAVGPYSHAVAASDLLFCSGQVPLDPATGTIVGETMGEQATRCLENLDAVCQAAGTRLRCGAVRLTIYTVDLGAFAEINAACEAFFDSARPPARATVQVVALPLGALVEIDAVVDLG
ncbi:MAG TPA: Rid family detoxifying hydrolase [Solirubrobacteraceae bacterium]|jgi:2-iminobutanoate/2-iminopropanoate deaminase|nr:Rid family detoxifying hydrolase [Solirubrobacteraceae bacterium]